MAPIISFYLYCAAGQTNNDGQSDTVAEHGHTT